MNTVDPKKCYAGLEARLVSLFNATSKPAIFTEFGQACCPTNGVCEQCPQYAPLRRADAPLCRADVLEPCARAPPPC